MDISLYRFEPQNLSQTFFQFEHRTIQSYLDLPSSNGSTRQSSVAASRERTGNCHHCTKMISRTIKQSIQEIGKSDKNKKKKKIRCLNLIKRSAKIWFSIWQNTLSSALEGPSNLEGLANSIRWKVSDGVQWSLVESNGIYQRERNLLHQASFCPLDESVAAIIVVHSIFVFVILLQCCDIAHLQSAPPVSSRRLNATYAFRICWRCFSVATFEHSSESDAIRLIGAKPAGSCSPATI